MKNIKKIIGLFFLALGVGRLSAQTASFNFSLSTHSVSGWTNVTGDPSVAVRTATGSSGITISSMATDNWAPFSSTSAFDGGGASGGSFFPSGVMANLWYQYSSFYGAYNSAVPQLEIGGLNIDSVYTIKMTGSLSTNVPNVFTLNPTRFTVAGTAVYGFIDVNENFNTTDGATFHNIAPNSSGKIHIYVNTLSSTNLAGIGGLQITSGHTTAPTPTVSIDKPTNGSIFPEDGSVSIAASASETGGTIARVEFYADTTLLGIDSVAPYTFIWSNLDPGSYAIKARAVDGLGNTASTTINITVESLNYFWSTTGNIAVNSDTFFLGTVDTSKLVIRTKNLARMAVDSNGKVGIGTTIPTAQLHTTGTVRLAGLTKDSTKTRVLVSDTLGNLSYTNVTSVSNRWLFAGGTTYDSTDNVGIGTSNTQGYKLAVNGTAIFTKVRVKTAGTWPDYVFKKGYDLMNLEDLEEYLTKHKHLPGILPEGEVQRDGIDVAEHDASVLKKVEELTLYLIEENKKLKEQNKQLEQQNSRLEQQQKEIDELKKLIRKEK